MAYTYSGDPLDSDKDEVRFLLQDTDPGTLPLLTDEEIEFLLDRWLPKYDSVTYVAAVAADTISRKFVGIVSISVDGVSVNTADLAQRYRDLAVQLRNEYVAGQIGAEVPLDNIMVGGRVDYSIAPLNFSIGLHDNPQAGQQDYGGQTGTPWVEWPG
jgi:hypothetical protein